MQRDPLIEQYLQLVARLDAEHGWNLSPADRRRYALQVAAFARDATEARQRALLRHYHDEHPLVEALRDPHYPDHARRWDDLAARVRKLVADHHVANPNALVREVLADLRRNLPTFQYQSHLWTWICVVISRHLVRLGAAAASDGAHGMPN